jgi:hypothetical protein
MPDNRGARRRRVICVSLFVVLVSTLAAGCSAARPAASPSLSTALPSTPAAGAPAFCSTLASAKGLQGVSEAVRKLTDPDSAAQGRQTLTAAADSMAQLATTTSDPVAAQLRETSRTLKLYISKGMTDADVARNMTDQWIRLGETLEGQCQFTVG